MTDIYHDRWNPLQDGGVETPIDPSVRIGQNVRIGLNVVIERGCRIGDGSIIGHNVVLRPETAVGRDCRICHGVVCEGDTLIGDRVTVHDQTHLTKGIIIEDDVFIGPGVVTSNTKKIVHGRKIPLAIRPPIILRGARIGAGTIILPGVEIGEEAMIGAGSLVVKDCRAYSVYYGRPAICVQDVPAEEWLIPPPWAADLSAGAVKTMSIEALKYRRTHWERS